MNRIKVLPEHVAHQIAAGEVIERPLSIVKELVENSIDSGANKIDVYIEKGGLSQIKVVDNGSGIVKDDLGVALQQHATSKISKTDDLYTVMSLGFRGEALASIASVAKIKITSLADDAEHAYSISNDLKIENVAHSKGTTVCVKDLFYNIPVRRKFLKTENTEYINIEQMFNRLAFSHFDIHFRLFKDGKLVKNLPAATNRSSQDLRLRDICGLEMLENCSYISVEQNGINLCGWLGLPIYDRPQGDRQFFYLNGRSIRDKVIMHAIKQAFLTYDSGLRYPVYCLYMNIDSTSVDINVHPTKNEVRFREPRIVHNFITETIEEYISQAVSDNREPHISDECKKVENEGEVDSSLYNRDFNSNKTFGSNRHFQGHGKDVRELSNNYKDIINYNVNDRVSFPVSNDESETMFLATPKIVCVRVNSGLQIVHIERVWRSYIQKLGGNELKAHKKLFEHKLLSPCEVTVDKILAEHMEEMPEIYSLLGFDIDRISDVSILLRSVPRILQEYDWRSSVKSLNIILNEHLNNKAGDIQSIFANFVMSLSVPELNVEQVSKIIANAGDSNSRIFTEKELIRML